MSAKDTAHSAMIANGVAVLQTEASAVETLARTLDHSFAAAVEAVLAAKGRLIVSGMGKSGHIAHKIAATMASTGTPAMFVHPGEASHGDLGMITRDDVVLLLSNSGETSELADLIAYTRRFGITMIGVASKPESTLLTKSDIAITLPPAEEACPNGLAPTTSTTMTLALGDALAVALMKERQFTPENFRDFHPGGKLGALLATVGDLMHGDDQLPLLNEQTPMTEALLTISAKGFGIAGVVDAAGKLAGVITDGDLRRNMTGLLEKQAGEVMTREPLTVAADALAREAVTLMKGRKVVTLFVVDADTKPVGILQIHDCLRAGLA
ncbi:KpsF/GutQ family sugar-phosphate isomerase [Halovulum sp. GXIMD14793]